MDHAAFNELDAYVTYAKGSDDVDGPARVPDLLHTKMHECGDDPHKLQIVFRTASNKSFGKTKGVGARSYMQLLYLMGHVTHKFGNGMLCLMQVWLGSAQKLNNFPVVNEQRWGLVGVACKEFLRRRTWTSESGEKMYYPGMFKDLAGGSRGLARTVLVEIAQMCCGALPNPFRLPSIPLHFGPPSPLPDLVSV